MAAELTLEQIEKHGEDCFQPLTTAKADLERARAALTKAVADKVQTEARLRTAETLIEDAAEAAKLFGRGQDPEALWKGAEAARKADWLAAAELAKSGVGWNRRRRS